MIHIWHEDSENSATTQFWEYLKDNEVSNVFGGADIQGFGGNYKVVNALKTEGGWRIMVDSNSSDLTRISYRETGDLFADTCEIVESAQRIAYMAVDTTLVQRNWLLGKRISLDCLDKDGKADYGKKTMKKLSAELKEKYGKGFDFGSLYKYVRFYQSFPRILDSLSPKFGRPLSWTHYRILLQETSPKAQAWYEKEAQEQAWSVRTLQRNISSQYYYRMLMSQNLEPVEAEMKELTASYQEDKLEFIKNPVIAEFLGLESNIDFTETELEQHIITHIQKFLMEMGKGYAFVARQQHIQIRMRILQNILFCMGMSNCLHPNIKHIFRQRNNCERKLRFRNIFTICRKKKKMSE